MARGSLHSSRRSSSGSGSGSAATITSCALGLGSPAGRAECAPLDGRAAGALDTTLTLGASLRKLSASSNSVNSHGSVSPQQVW